MPRHVFKKGDPKPATSGRKKGTLNRKTRIRLELVETIKASGKDPLTFFSEVLANEANPFSVRFKAAEAMAPYMHPKLSSIESRTGGTTHEERLQRMREMLERQKPRELVLTQQSDGSHAVTRGVDEPADEGGG